jgi:hypothetical protein
VVHDRIRVEASVLPRYFNHSSFASLRRQLNYFSFVRLGKGRQRESTYINEGVIRLDDILTLKRRPAGAPSLPSEEGGGSSAESTKERTAVSLSSSSSVSSAAPHKPHNYVDSIVPVVHLPSRSASSKGGSAKKTKRVKHPKKAARQEFHQYPSDINDNQQAPSFVSEDEQSQDKVQKCTTSLALDLTQSPADRELLEGCSALLGLSGKNTWR